MSNCSVNIARTSPEYLIMEHQKSDAHNVVINDSVVKIEPDISSPINIKIEFNDNPLVCDHCQEIYLDYCTKCGMLVHILNRNVFDTTKNRTTEEMPRDILETKESYGQVGVYAVKVIPEGVKFGPFVGLSASECPWKLKGGKFVVGQDKTKYLNWMQYINPARNIFQQNLIPFQYDDDLYYRSNREIQEGDQLLVYFGEEYEDNLNKDVVVDFIPPLDGDVRDVFACTFCCFGFSSKSYLTKHKSTCSKKHNGSFLGEELTQCPFCKIYLDKREHFEYHKPYCSERNTRKDVPLSQDNQTVEIHKATSKKDLTSHAKKNLQMKKGGDRADSGSQDKEEQLKCRECAYRASTMQNLNIHVKTKHLKEFTYKCCSCPYKTNYTTSINRHMKTKHIRKFNFKCDVCEYKTNLKANLTYHTKNNHREKVHYECEKCEYKSTDKSHLERHIKTRHLQEFDYKCEFCEYGTNIKPNLVKHVKTKHLKKFDYECASCSYKTNRKDKLIIHIKTKHIKQFDYKCEKCDFETNRKIDFDRHVAAQHDKFAYECETCGFKASQKFSLKTHIETKHLKEFKYKCDTCEYKSCRKSYLQKHIKTKHLNEFEYNCAKCKYGTNYAKNLDKHVKRQH